MPEFPPITHVAVTVTDLERSTRWYSELLGAGPVLDEDEQAGGFHHTVFALAGGQLLGLHTHPRAAGDRFDEYRTGLDQASAHPGWCLLILARIWHRFCRSGVRSPDRGTAGSSAGSAGCGTAPGANLGFSGIKPGWSGK